MVERMIDIGGAEERRRGRGDGQQELPDRLAVLPLRDAVTFPDLVVPLNVGQERSSR